MDLVGGHSFCTTISNLEKKKKKTISLTEQLIVLIISAIFCGINGLWLKPEHVSNHPQVYKVWTRIWIVSILAGVVSALLNLFFVSYFFSSVLKSLGLAKFSSIIFMIWSVAAGLYFATRYYIGVCQRESGESVGESGTSERK